jgi:hypothetical protein
MSEELEKIKNALERKIRDRHQVDFVMERMDIKEVAHLYNQRSAFPTFSTEKILKWAHKLSIITREQAIEIWGKETLDSK